MSHLYYPDNVTAFVSKLATERIRDILITTYPKRAARVAVLQMEIQEALDTLAALLQDESRYQQRMGILQDIAQNVAPGKPNPLSTLPEFGTDKRATSALSMAKESAYEDLKGSNNIIVKDPQLVLAFNHMLNTIASVDKYLRLHEHRIKNAKLQMQVKARMVELIQEEISNTEDGGG